MKLPTNKLDLILQYILLIAGQSEPPDNQLGMIHFVKYVYLADLEYAKYHGGRTYTGLEWTFHNFGPWSVDCFKRVEPAINLIGAERQEIESKYGDQDFIRWSLDDEDQLKKVERHIDLTVHGAVQKYVRKFGSDTARLLDYVYKTKPMINAAPEEVLDFTSAVKQDKTEYDIKFDLSISQMTPREKKKKKQKIEEFKAALNARFDEKIKNANLTVCPLSPRYDEVFYKGLEDLEDGAETTLPEGRYLGKFSEEIWKSGFRNDPELS